MDEMMNDYPKQDNIVDDTSKLLQHHTKLKLAMHRLNTLDEVSEYSDPSMQDNLSDAEDPFYHQEYPRFADECKRFDLNFTPQYAETIIQNIQKTEKSVRIPIANFKKIQQEITIQNRDQLVNWLISVHYNLGISSNALHNAIYYFDLVVSTQNIPKNKIQLYGCVCLSIAAKVESFNCRFVKTILDEYTHGFTKEDYDECEMSIICLLKYELQFPTSYQFLKRLFVALQSQPNLMFLCLLVCESSLLSFQIHRFDPSVVAVAIYILCSSFLNIRIPFATLKNYSHLDKLQKVEKCIPILIHCADEVLASDSATLKYFEKSDPSNSLQGISFGSTMLDKIKMLELSLK